MSAAKKSLPMGEERDGLKANAEKVLRKGQPEPTPKRELYQPSGRAMEKRASREAIAAGNSIFDKGRQMNAEREADDLFTSARKGNTPAGQPVESTNWDDPYLTLGGVKLSKRQVFNAINNDLPRIMTEVEAGRTTRAKFLAMTVLPLVKPLLEKFRREYAQDVAEHKAL